MSKNNATVNISRKVCIAVFVLSATLMLLCEIFKGAIFGDGERGELFYSLASRVFGIILSFVLVLYCGFREILKSGKSHFFNRLLVVLPCWVIAINNFPIIPVLLGQARITDEPSAILLFAIVCLSVGLFEELAYRGCVFMLVLRNSKKTKKGLFLSVIISSALFGLVHVVNLFVGANPLGVILQVGYSFLIGAMCAFVLIKTGSVWHSALIHAVYNFCGGVVANYGEGRIWTAPEVALTAVIGVAVAIYVSVALYRTDVGETMRLLGENKEGADGNVQ